MTDAGEGVVQPDDLGADDLHALGWAVSSGHTIGVAILERARSGGPGLTAGELEAIREDWDRAGRPTSAQHVHRTAVTFPDGTVVTGVTFAADDPYGRDGAPPSFGLYLDERWRPPWSHAHVEWPDFGVPADADLDGLRAALVDLLARARRGEAVEIGCLGGHGRTGTALGCLAVLAGVEPDDAVAWVRANYCDQAVETPDQEAFVAAFPP